MTAYNAILFGTTPHAFADDEDLKRCLTAILGSTYFDREFVLHRLEHDKSEQWGQYLLTPLAEKPDWKLLATKLEGMPGVRPVAVRTDADTLVMPQEIDAPLPAPAFRGGVLPQAPYDPNRKLRVIRRRDVKPS